MKFSFHGISSSTTDDWVLSAKAFSEIGIEDDGNFPIAFANGHFVLELKNSYLKKTYL